MSFSAPLRVRTSAVPATAINVIAMAIDDQPSLCQYTSRKVINSDASSTINPKAIPSPAPIHERAFGLRSTSPKIATAASSKIPHR